MKFIILLKKKLAFFGIDGAIFYTSLARIIQALTGVITIFFVARFLTSVEQGFYYTFGSILAIQIFFELGLNGIITQYVAHEVSHLTWESETKLSGSQFHRSRLSSLLHFSVKWYLLFGSFLFLILLIAGVIFFNKYDKSGGAVEWIIPWFVLAVSTIIAFLVNPVLSFLEGLGKVKDVAQMRLIQQLITTFILWTALIIKAKLYSSGISSLFGLLVIATIIYVSSYRKLLLNIWTAVEKESVNYKKEIFPYQWKIALSWISGYFIFQLFNPVLFATEGAEIAGQMGMTLAVLNGIFSLSFSWMSTKVPLYSGLIAQNKYNELDSIFNKTLKQSVFINVLGLTIMLFAIYVLRYYGISLGNRFLPYLPLFLMMAPIIMNQFVSSWATYLRCHKQEPFLINSLVGGVSVCLSTIILGRNFGINGMAIGYCIITFLVGILWGGHIFRTKKIVWH